MKKLLLALALVSSSVIAEEQTIDIPAYCLPTPSMIMSLGEFKVLLTNEDTATSGSSITDLMVFSQTKNAVFIMRENKSVGYTCVLSMFEKK